MQKRLQRQQERSLPWYNPVANSKFSDQRDSVTVVHKPPSPHPDQRQSLALLSYEHLGCAYHGGLPSCERIDHTQNCTSIHTGENTNLRTPSTGAAPFATPFAVAVFLGLAGATRETRDAAGGTTEGSTTTSIFIARSV